jgi:stage V sporulation protein B
MSVGALAMTAGMGGIRTATMYLTAEELGRKKPQNVTWVLSGCFLYSILCSGVIATALYFAAPFLAENWVGDPQIIGSLRLFALFLPLVCLCGCMTGYFTAAGRIGTLAAVEVCEQVCYMAVTMTLLTLWARQDAVKACAAVVLGSGIGTVFTLTTLVILRLLERPKTGRRIPVTSRILRTAVPLAIADDVKSGISNTENLMVPRRLALYPGEQNPLATFGTVCGMVFPVLMFPAAILFALAELLIPELARCNAADSRVRIRYLAQKSLRLAMLYGCFCAGILYLIAQPLCMSLYSSVVAGDYLQLYSLLIPMLYCDTVTDAMIKGLGQQTASVRYNIFTSAMDVILLFALLPHYGMHGYFFSFLITHLINFLLSLRRLLKITGIKIPLYVPMLCCTCTLLGGIGGSFMMGIPGKILGFLGIWGSLLVLFGILSREDIHWLLGLLRKKRPAKMAGLES